MANYQTEPVKVQVFFSGDAEAHGLRAWTPGTGPMRCTGLGVRKGDTETVYFIGAKIDESNHADNVGRTFELRIEIPQNGAAEGAIKAREAALKALKIAVAAPEKQAEVAAVINSKKGTLDYGIDVYNKKFCVYYEPGNPDAPQGKEQKAHPAYDQGFAFFRFITEDVYQEVKTGRRAVALRNTPLKSGSGNTGAVGGQGIAGMTNGGLPAQPPSNLPLPAGMNGAPQTATPPQQTAAPDPAADML